MPPVKLSDDELERRQAVADRHAGSLAREVCCIVVQQTSPRLI
jgi:hypothetical protein